MVGGEGSEDLVLGRGGGSGGGGLDGQLAERGGDTGEGFLHGGQRDHGDVVLVLGSVGSFGLQQADDGVGGRSELDLGTDGVVGRAAEQVGDHGGAEHDDLGVVGLVVGGEEPSQLRGVVAYLLIGGQHPDARRWPL